VGVQNPHTAVMDFIRANGAFINHSTRSILK
jgi:hypothetical protein